jgi:putative lysine decarboxylase
VRVLADSVLVGGGQAISVMPRSLVKKEIAHTALTQLHVVESMHERKALMLDLADAFVLLPSTRGIWRLGRILRGGELATARDGNKCRVAC